MTAPSLFSSKSAWIDSIFGINLSDCIYYEAIRKSSIETIFHLVWHKYATSLNWFSGADSARVLIPMKQTKSAWSDNWLIVHSKVFAVQRHKKSSLMTQTQTLFGFCDAWDCSDLWMIIIIWKFEWMLMQVLEKTLVRLNSLEHFSSFSGRKAIHLQWHYSWNAYLVQNFWIDVVLTV